MDIVLNLKAKVTNIALNLKDKIIDIDLNWKDKVIDIDLNLNDKVIQGLRLAVAQSQMRVTFVLGDI
jgi:hypothetical protein